MFAVSGRGGDPIGEQCEIKDPGGAAVRDPSWSPDGKALTYWSPGTGIWTTPFDGTCASLAPKVVVGNGGQGDWGPADPGVAATVPAAGATVRVHLKGVRTLGRAGHRRLRVKGLAAGGSAATTVRVKQ